MAARWYIINVLSGYEQKVAVAIRKAAEQKNVSELFEEVVVPVENVTELKKGKKTTTSKKIFPGYVMIKMDFNDLTWSIVKNVPSVAGLLGGGGKPAPVPEKEVMRVMQQVADGAVTKEIQVLFTVGESVKILEGPFETFSGIIEEVDNEKRRVKLMVSIFGRSTPVELEFNQIERLK